MTTCNTFLSPVTLYCTHSLNGGTPRADISSQFCSKCSKSEEFLPTVNRSYKSYPELNKSRPFSAKTPSAPLTLALDAGGNVACRPHVYCIVLAVRFTRAFVSYLRPGDGFLTPKHTSKKLTARENNESWARTPNINVRDPFWVIFYPRFHP